MEEDKNKDIINLAEVFRTLMQKRKTFFFVWPIVFALSCLWIFPQPRYYISEVKLAPEAGVEKGSLSSLVSSFGFNIGKMDSQDAVYPKLYPELFESPEFETEILKIEVVSDDETIKTDYYTYLSEYQKKNWLTQPLVDARKAIADMLSSEPETSPCKSAEELNPFKMSKKDHEIIRIAQKNIACNIDKNTSVITLTVKDQDRQICALLVDSIKERLQNFIVDYRTKKVRQDVTYYQHLTDCAKCEYENALSVYANYNDGHRNLTLQSYIEYGKKLKNDMDIKLQTYNTFNAQLAAAKAKVQERTPSFTTLKSATVPVKPAGPKRMLFVAGMLIFSTVIMSLFLSRKEILGK